MLPFVGGSYEVSAVFSSGSDFGFGVDVRINCVLVAARGLHGWYSLPKQCLPARARAGASDSRYTPNGDATVSAGLHGQHVSACRHIAPGRVGGPGADRSSHG